MLDEWRRRVDTIGQRLKHARNRRALSQTELAEAAGVSKVTVVHIEKDRYSRLPNQATIRKLAEALGVDPGWLLTGEGDPSPRRPHGLGDPGSEHTPIA